MTAAIRLSAIAAAVLIVLFFPFRFNAGAYADFKNKKFGAKIYLFNFVRLFKIEGEADGLRLTLEGTINKQVDLLRDKMSSPKGLFLLKALKIKALHVTILHDIMNYFSESRYGFALHFRRTCPVSKTRRVRKRELRRGQRGGDGRGRFRRYADKRRNIIIEKGG